jgi:hypothetical protein
MVREERERERERDDDDDDAIRTPGDSVVLLLNDTLSDDLLFFSSELSLTFFFLPLSVLLHLFYTILLV